jgi:hypothetical protein
LLGQDADIGKDLETRSDDMAKIVARLLLLAPEEVRTEARNVHKVINAAMHKLWTPTSVSRDATLFFALLGELDDLRESFLAAARDDLNVDAQR